MLVAAALAAGFVALWTLALGLAGRTYSLIRLFPGFAMLRHAARAIAPSVPAAAAVLGMRVLEIAGYLRPRASIT